ncbi:MAG: hypothetical protein ACTSQY_10720 [Candidatus Odinarchaeia archaeon]
MKEELIVSQNNKSTEKLSTAINELVEAIIGQVTETSEKQSEELKKISNELDKWCNKTEKISKTLNENIAGLNEKLENIVAELAALKDNLSSLEQLPDKLSDSFNTKVNQLTEVIDSKLGETKEDVLNKLFEDSTSFHEELEKVIDMTAALTVELSSKLDNFQQKIDKITESSSDEKSLINEVKSEITTIMDRQATVFESRIDGLKKQIDEEIMPKLNSLESINSVLNRNSKQISSIESKIEKLTSEKEKTPKKTTAKEETE